jgi:hypothetical protein
MSYCTAHVAVAIGGKADITIALQCPLLAQSGHEALYAQRAGSEANS